MRFNTDLLYSAVEMNVEIKDEFGNTLQSSRATGFFISFGIGKMVLVTNRHVVDPTWEAPGRYNNKFLNYELDIKYFGRIGKDDKKIGFKLDSTNFIYPDSYNNDIAILHAKNAMTDHGGILIIERFVHSTMLCSPDSYGTDIVISDEVAFVGYTEWNSAYYDRPMLRMGRIVADPQFEINTNQVKGDAFLIEGFSTSGMSGSPVYALQRGLDFACEPPFKAHDPNFRRLLLIGVNAGYLGSANHQHAQLSYAFKTGSIWECARKIFKNVIH